MLFKTIGAAMLTLGLSINAFAGDFGAGNGGDVVHCKKSNSNSLNGVYSLDYVLTFNRRNKNADIIQIDNWKESSERLLRIFKNYLPNYFKSLSTYIKHVGNFVDYNAPYIWLDYPGQLIDIKDEDLIRKIPQNCQTNNNQIFQAVIRKYSARQVQFEIDGNLYDQLEKSPLQYSFLMMHEYLWNVFGSSREIRSFNRILHSNIFEGKPKNEILNILAKFSIGNSGVDLVSNKIFNETLDSFFIDSSDNFYEVLKSNYNRDIFSRFSSIEESAWERSIREANIQLPKNKKETLSQLWRFSNLSLSTYALIFSKDGVLKKLFSEGLITKDPKFLQAFALGYGRLDIVSMLDEIGTPSPSFYLNNKEEVLYRKAVLFAVLENDNLENYLKLKTNLGFEVNSADDIATIINYKSKKVLEYLISEGINIWKLTSVSDQKTSMRFKYSTNECFGRNCYIHHSIKYNEANSLFPWILRESNIKHLQFINSLSGSEEVFKALKEIKWDIEVEKQTSKCITCSWEHSYKNDTSSTHNVLTKLSPTDFKNKILNLLY